MTQNLAVDGYLAGDVLAALRTSGRRLRFRYEWLAQDGTTKGWLPNIQAGGSIAYSYTSTIKRTATFTMIKGLDPGFNFTSDRVRPWIGVQMPDGGYADFPQGVFLIFAPDTTYSGGLTTMACAGRDQGQVLTDDCVGSRYVVSAGTAYTDAIEVLLVGIPSTNVVESDLTLPVDRDWDPGTTKVSIVNDLLTAINYGSLWFDGFGTAQVLPYIDPGSDEIGLTYSDVGGASLFAPEITSTLDLSAVPNFIRYTVSQPDRPVLTSTWVNNDPASPVSYPSRGRYVVAYDSTLDVATQTELDAAVRRAGINAANVYQKVAFSTPIMPVHENRDVLFIEHTGLGLSDTFAETDWSIELQNGGAMTHTVRRVVNLDVNLVGTPDDS